MRYEKERPYGCKPTRIRVQKVGSARAGRASSLHRSAVVQFPVDRILAQRTRRRSSRPVTKRSSRGHTRGSAGSAWRADHTVIMPASAPLLDGTLRYDALSRNGSRFELRLKNTSDSESRVLSPQERLAIQLLLLGHSQKEIAFQLGVSITTVSTLIRISLKRLGIPCWQHVVLAAAFLERARTATGSDAGCVITTDQGIYAISVELSSALLALTEAEREVVLAAADGGSNEQIACTAKKSVRTVANQLASAFKKLGARGRGELLRCIVLQTFSST